MSSDETKIEPTLTLMDAPSIAIEPAKPENDANVEARIEAQPETKAEIRSEPVLTAAAEAYKLEAPKMELPGEAPTLPPAPQIDPVVAFKQPEPVSAPVAPIAPAAPVRATRFALLAASVAIAASFGAVGGSLGVAKFGPTMASAPAVAPVAKEHVAEEVRALKESLAQLRATTKSLSDNLAALKTTVSATGTQNSKIAEALERIEKSQAEQRRTASTTEVTGSIGQKTAVPMVLGDPPTTLKPPIVPGWTLRRVYDGAALLEGRDGIIEVEPGVVAPGLGRIEAIKRQDGRWVVVTARGLVVGR